MFRGKWFSVAGWGRIFGGLLFFWFLFPVLFLFLCGYFPFVFSPCFVVYCFVLICLGDSDLNAKMNGGDLFMIVELTTCSLQ